jgi:hypothetical protein
MTTNAVSQKTTTKTSKLSRTGSYLSEEESSTSSDEENHSNSLKSNSLRQPSSATLNNDPPQGGSLSNVQDDNGPAINKDEQGKDKEELGTTMLTNMIMPEEFQHLTKYLHAYKPVHRELPSLLKPFFPPYMPVIGDVDDFIKPHLPPGAGAGVADADAGGSSPQIMTNNDDAKNSKLALDIFGEDNCHAKENENYGDLGLKVMDEPALVQSDVALLELELRNSNSNIMMIGTTGSGIGTGAVVPKIEDAHRVAQKSEIQDWINKTTEIHERNPLPFTFDYTISPDMPSSQELLLKPCPWAGAAREALRARRQPSTTAGQKEVLIGGEGSDALMMPHDNNTMLSKTDLSLEEQIKVMCAMFDIPFRTSTARSSDAANDGAMMTKQRDQQQAELGVFESAHALFSLCQEFQWASIEVRNTNCTVQ